MNQEDKYKPKQNHVLPNVPAEDPEDIKLLKEVIAKLDELLAKTRKA